MIAKALIRDAIAAGLSVLNTYDKVLKHRGRWLILTFHRVLPVTLRQSYPLPNLAVTPQELAWVIETLKPFFDIKTVTDAATCWRTQDDFAPMLSITFDDGQWDNIEYALPVLKQQQVPATFYLPTDFINTDNLLWHDEAAFAWRVLIEDGRCQQNVMTTLSQKEQAQLDTTSAASFVRSLKTIEPVKRRAVIDILMEKSGAGLHWARMMTWDEARQLLAAGHEVGSHGCSHNLLPQQDTQQQLAEIEHSKQAIEKQLHITPQSFCYPNGDYNEQTLKLLTGAGYDNAVTTLWGVNDKSAADYQLYRCDMNPFLMTDRKARLSRNRLLMRLSGFQRGDGR